MSIQRQCALFLIVLILAASPAAAGWHEVRRADMAFDLPAARAEALQTISNAPASMDAIAAATWWLANIEDISDPEEVLAVDATERDPELGFILGLIEHRLRFEPPPGALNDAELAGAFGVFTILDLERHVVPPDGALPAPGTRWTDPSRPVRLPMRTPDGRFGPPRSMAIDGIYLVAWNLKATAPATGWLVVEAAGGFNLEVDGVEIDRRRHCGRTEPEITWYRVRLDEGNHRVRVEIGATEEPQVRLTLLDDLGAPMTTVSTVDEQATELATSEIERAEPPAARDFRVLLEGDKVSIDELLLAAQIERGRGDPVATYRFLERARAIDPLDPWPALALGEHLILDGNSGRAPETSRRIVQHLRVARKIPGTSIFDRLLAEREGRAEDAERLLDSMMNDHGDDVRVLRIWVREAVNRGWAREAEDGLGRLESALPGSLSVTGLRLEVLASLERWREREELLRALASATPVEYRWIGQMASSCLVDEAIAASRALHQEVDNPDFDIPMIRLQLESSHFDVARAELDRTRAQWGDLPIFDELELILSGDDSEELSRALDAALERNPSNLELLVLSWRLGAEPFFAPFRVNGDDFAAEYEDLGKDADVVLLLDQAVERIFPDGSSLYYYHGLSRANTPVGARRASQLQPLADSHQIMVRIIKPDGRVVVPVDVQGGQAVANLSEVEAGDLVEEEYVSRVAATGASRRGHLPPYIYRFADPDRAFGLSEYVLLVPNEIDVQVDGNLEGLDREESDWRGLRLLRWRNENVPAVATEPFSPPAAELMPWLNYGFGVSWNDVGDAVRDRVLPVLRTSPDLQAWAERVMQGKTAAVRLEALVGALVDEVQPGNTEIAIGFAAGETFAYRRGNRLGILASVLADQGWTVDLVLTRPTTDRDQRLELPTLDAFPVTLLRVADGDEEFWIDMREEERGVDHINPFFQGSDGLVLPLTRPELAVSRIDELPIYENPELEEHVNVRAEVNPDGSARLAFRMHLRGNQAERLLEQIESVPEDQIPMVYRQIAVSMFPGASGVEGRIDSVEDDSIIELLMTLPAACDVVPTKIECRSLILSNPLVPVLAALPERRYPLLLQMPIIRRLELEIIEPSGWVLEDRPPRRLDTQWGSVSEDLDRGAGSLRSVLSISVPSQKVATEDYRAFARFCQAIDEISTRPPTLVPVR